jgi:hypothetical protein
MGQLWGGRTLPVQCQVPGPAVTGVWTLKGPAGAVFVMAVRSTAIALNTVPRRACFPIVRATTTCDPVNRYVPPGRSVTRGPSPASPICTLSDPAPTRYCPVTGRHVPAAVSASKIAVSTLVDP